MHAFSQPLRQPQPVAMAVLGDSLACGLGATREEAGLAQLLHAQLRAERPGSTLYSFGVPHATMGDVLRHQVPRLHGLDADVVLLIAGANDLRYTRDALAIARRFRSLLEAIRLAVPRAQIVAGGMPDVTQTIAVPRVLKPAIQRLCARLNERMREITRAGGDGFMDMFEFTSAPLCSDADYLCEDGFHPNDFGYAEIARRAYPAIRSAAQAALR
jgi:lysophospholipase L1-like esterase